MFILLAYKLWPNKHRPNADVYALAIAHTLGQLLLFVGNERSEKFSRFIGNILMRYRIAMLFRISALFGILFQHREKVMNVDVMKS